MPLNNAPDSTWVGPLRVDGPAILAGPVTRKIRFTVGDYDLAPMDSALDTDLSLDDVILVATPPDMDTTIKIHLPDVVEATGREYIIAHAGAVGGVDLVAAVGQFINYDSLEEGVATHNTRHLYSIGTTWLLLS